MTILTSIAGFAARPVLTAAAPYLIVAAVAAGGGFLTYEIHHQRQIGRDQVQAKWDADNTKKANELAAFNAEVRRMDQRRQSLTTEAANAAQKQTQMARKDADGARAERDGLRDDLTAARTQLASASENARAKYSAAVDAVFADCTRRYTDMAEAAQGHAIDSLMYQQGWPK